MTAGNITNAMAIGCTIAMLVVMYGLWKQNEPWMPFLSAALIAMMLASQFTACAWFATH